jgi:UDP-N-acetylmuramate: L-alanyl-gamma-D-glutamyl-meso-diaminopimelate ligase
MPRHYHLIGIGGTAMASLAGLLRAAGHAVTGSDEGIYPPMSDQLRTLGIAWHDGYLPANLEPRPDVVVVGNAISRGNPELEAVLDAGLPYTSAADVIKREFLQGRHPLAVAGTHGKTTTASLLAWLLEAAGLRPSFLVGGIAENFGASFRLTDSPWFVIEADEYDTAYFDKGPKMWHYLPRTAVLGNVEFDHADIFRDDIAYRWAFSRFVNLIPRTGRLVAGWDDPAVRSLAEASPAPVESFAYAGPDRGSAADDARWTAVDVAFDGARTRFTVLRDGAAWAAVETGLPGAFNVRNCLAAVAAATAVGAARDRVVEGLRTFRSVRRRMEVRGTADDVTVVDDFAHHPTAVRETLRAARQRFAGRRLLAVFEPRSYTAQRREFQAPYLDALAGADAVIVAGLFHPERYTRDTALDAVALAAELSARGVPALHEPDVAAIVRALADGAPPLRAQPGDVVLIMSNGGFGGIHGRLLAALGARTAGC